MSGSTYAYYAYQNIRDKPTDEQNSLIEKFLENATATLDGDTLVVSGTCPVCGVNIVKRLNTKPGPPISPSAGVLPLPTAKRVARRMSAEHPAASSWQLNVSCECDHAHPDRPKDKQRGCGFMVKVTVGEEQLR